MKNSFWKFFPALIFTGVAVLAIVHNHDYIEAAIWGLFALAIVLPAFTSAGNSNERTIKLLAVGLMLLGIILLVLRLLNLLPVPVDPLP